MLVLVGVDGSSGARAALRWASDRAARTGARLVAVAAWQYPRTAALPGGPSLLSPEQMDADTEQDVRSIVVDELGEAGSSVAVQVERGPADWALLNLARRESADSTVPDTTVPDTILVVGKRGLGSLEGRLLGSVSRRIAELAPCPAVVVPADTADIDDDGPVVVGVDASPEAAAAVTWAIAEARSAGSGIVLVHGVAGLPAELPPSAIDRFIAQADDLVENHVRRVRAEGIEPVTVVEVVDPRHLLPAVASERRARLVVVGAKGEGAAAGLLIGSVVNHVVQQSVRPVAIVHGAVS